ncbi:MFS transporter [Aeromicrobium chenweiae]|uniref:MFS transporter n=1 Tax=Aeromicrobium chenweiae TaxID=2079793 RepID=A0A2S0WPJ7_9ACTN|nr:MFS transporter [Aeromicrobium chenweiae]
MLGATVLGTMANNIISVPLNTIAEDLDRPVASTVLAVSAFIIVLAVAIPVAGWVGDRLGRRRVLLAALLLMVVGQALASLAPGLELLIAARAVQGLACSAIPPMVMGMLVTFFPGQRLRVMGAWAAANGAGQALGPPIGGLIADAAGWRSIFVLMCVLSLVAFVAVARSVPSAPGHRERFDLPGALLLSSGMTLLLVAVTSVSLPGARLALIGGLAAIGLVLLLLFVAVSARNPHAMLPPHLLFETRFLRSSLAAFVQMFMLGTALVAVPLHLTGPLHMSSWHAGLLFFQLPVVMVLLAPWVGRAAARWSPRLILRIGLLTLVVGGALAGVVGEEADGTWATWLISAVLLVLGAGMALVQTPAAAGATRSPAGGRGAALGAFSMLRFSGSAAGTAWVAIGYHHGLLALFLFAAAVVTIGLAVTFVGPDPHDDPASAEPAY